jgi:putative ABC transport system permease protein
MRSEVSRENRGLAVTASTTMDRLVAESVALERYRSLLLAFFGAIATSLAAVGVAGIVVRAVSSRARELAVRMSVGASADALVWEEVGRASTFGLAATGVGLGLALVGAQALRRFLFGIRAADPVTFGGVAVLVLAIIVTASYLPARRITRVDPVTVLGSE